jgi:uncharacterized membrane protein YccC
VFARWLVSLADRLVASDYGLTRVRFATRAVLTVVLAVAVLALARLPSTELLVGAAAGMFCATSMRTGSTLERGRHILCYLPVIAVAATTATLLAPYRIVSDAVFVAVIFAAIWVRRYGQFGFGLGMGGFMAYFFATFLKASPSALPQLYLAVTIGLTSCAVVALGVLRDSPERTLRRTTESIRAQLVRLVDELVDLVEDDDPTGDDSAAGELPRAVARQAVRMHETTLQVEDSADLLGLDPRWQRQLVDAELSADRLARATVRALGDDLTAATRAELAEDLRGLRQFLVRDPEPAMRLDTDELLNRIARYDISGDPGLSPSAPEHHTLLVRRAIRELLLSVVQIRRTTLRVLADPSAARAGVSDREPTPEDADVGPDVDVGLASARTDDPRTDDPRAADGRGPGLAGRLRGLAPSTRSAVQASIGGALAIVGGELLSTQRWYWAVIAGFIVFGNTTSRGDLLVKSWRRVIGTLLGIVAGTVLATVLAGQLVLNAVAMLLCIFLGFYLLRVSYAAMTFFITIMLGMLYDILGTFTPGLLVLRLEETAIGVTASVVAAMLVLPMRTRTTVLTELHDYFTALHAQLDDARRLLVHADRVSVIAATREVDRAATEVRTAIAPMLYRMSPSRVRRGHATRLLTLTEESALAARNLARAAEPGALAELPEARHTLDRLIANTETLLAATDDSPGAVAGRTGDGRAELVSGAAVAPTVDLRAWAGSRNGASTPDRIEVLHLRRTLNCLDRLDKLLLGMAAPLERTITIPRESRVPTP